MQTNVFLIRCLSNMRVGNGEANYSLIDNEVERDAILGEPVINSSGVKGALREHFEKTNLNVSEYFGSKNGQGSYKFLQATSLFRPLRVSSGQLAFVESSSPVLIDYFNSTLDAFDKKIKLNDETGSTARNIEVEGEKPDKHIEKDFEIKKILETVFDGNGDIDYYVTDKLSTYPLPVQARNVLDDGGISTNLWYEEVVPHETIMWFAILSPDKIDDGFKKVLTNDVFQFGGSASVGYGLARIYALEV